ncbi:MAG: ChaN family lipoprotein [Candidatus Cyclonatronum sp.]|uniref:ChaN family lipoprotein n=1 Tax=Cyclonatronum sp. TaxID=3024185 RepID=UPI0025BCB592|nr:ChaN family lipoprotein [Cyclonatronum sp.]MCC5935364.1 ChaN family lipoprotein [Balneolales bacterium]MCH8487413.1 ChaN family lipoprotein [Cyclonatronum sp.]
MRTSAFARLLLVLLFAGLTGCSAQKLSFIEDNPSHTLFLHNGEPVSWAQVTELALAHDIILFGELHNNAVAHWLQNELTRALHADTTRALVIGMEMFEADQQLIVDEYIGGLITDRNFEEQARLWNNYATDYKPVMLFARQHGIPVIATNIPRRYASMVFREGLEAFERLDEQALSWIAPLPVTVDLELPGYANITQMSHGHGGDNLALSQASKDATMAHFILANFDAAQARHLHLNGAYHSDNFEGIYWYLRHYGFEGRIMTITTSDESEPGLFNEALRDRATVILQVHERMTKTY